MVREQDFLNSHPLDKYIDEQSANESEIINSTNNILKKMNRRLMN